MLTMKKEVTEFDIIVKKGDNGKYKRMSKPFKNDNKPRAFFTLHLRMLSKIGTNGKRTTGGQVNTIHRNIWEDRQSVVFDDITAEIKEGNIDSRDMLTDLCLEGAFYIAPTPQPYIQEINGTKRTQKFVRFFVLAGESPEQEYERACNGLEYIAIDDVESREEDTDASTAADTPAATADDDI